MRSRRKRRSETNNVRRKSDEEQNIWSAAQSFNADRSASAGGLSCTQPAPLLLLLFLPPLLLCITSNMARPCCQAGSVVVRLPLQSSDPTRSEQPLSLNLINPVRVSIASVAQTGSVGHFSRKKCRFYFKL